MDYEETLEYLNTLGKFGIHLGLERIEGLLAILDHPEKKFKSIHITGTNGKGSVSAFLTGALIGMGLKTGCFTSPHFVKYNERISLNGKDISDEDFSALATKVAEAEKQFKAQGGEQPTQFEVITTMGFLYFAQKKVDYAVVEVGMGGLWDSTNVLLPQVSVITNVTFDHMERLGKTIEAIAQQKAGIIKEHVPVITAATGAALQVVSAKSKEKHATLYVYGKDFTGQEETASMAGQTFIFTGQGKEKKFKILLPGSHQIINCAVALAALEVLAKEDSTVNCLGLGVSLAQVKWPGRLERIAKHPDVILDGAHNPSGVTVLRKTLDQYYTHGSRCFVFGMMKDKDITKAVTILFRPEDKVFTVLADHGQRAASAEFLAQKIGNRALPCKTLLQAYEKAVVAAGQDGMVCVCGSLYLVGLFKETMEKG